MRRGIVGLLVVLGALAFAPAALADECPGQPPMEQPFAAWGDNGDYFLAPGGDFGPSNTTRSSCHRVPRRSRRRSASPTAIATLG